MVFDGTESYVTIAPAEGEFVLDGDFTIDCWANQGTSAEHRRLIGIGSQVDGPGGQVFLGMYANTSFNFGFWNGEGNTEWNFTIPYTEGEWAHFAICRVNNILYFFHNGILLDSEFCSTTFTAGESGVIVGARYEIDSANIVEYFNGYIDEVRIVKGTGQWTENFTPPISPYSH